MAIKITGMLQPNSGSYVASADNIVFSTGGTPKSVATALSEILEILSNLEEVDLTEINNAIEEIQTTLESISLTATSVTYSYQLTTGEGESATTETVNTTVGAVLNTLRAKFAEIDESLETLESISTSVTAAAGSATAAALSEANAKLAEASVKRYSETLSSQVEAKYQEILLIKNQTSDYVSSVTPLIEQINEVASALNATFETNGNFAIMTKSAYEALTDNQIGGNTVYFIYDDGTTDVVPFMITTAVNNNDGGKVIGGGSYYSGAEVALYAVPNANYVFAGWQEDENMTNPRVITVTTNATYTAKFDLNTQE